MKLQAAGAILSDPGHQRAINEDWCGSWLPDDAMMQPGSPSIWIVADGVSHYGTGRDAARCAVESMLSAGWDASPEDVPGALEAALHRANQALWERRGAPGQPERLSATTIVAAAVLDADAWIVAAGDCRAYLLRRGEIRQITRDHTVAAEEVRQGRLRPEDIEHHPGRHTLLRCLGNRATVQPDAFHERLQAGDRLMLCSDGLFRHVTDAELLQIGASSAPAIATQRLIDLANERGGSDNITVGIVEITPAPDGTHAPSAVPPPSAMGRSAQLQPAQRPDLLGVLQDVGRRITASPALPDTLRAVLACLLDIFSPDRACIILREEDTGTLMFELGQNLTAADLEHGPSGVRRVVGRVLRTGEPLLSGDALAAPGAPPIAAAGAQEPHSSMGAPLLVRGLCIGVLYVDRVVSTVSYTMPDVDLLSMFASMAAGGIDNARLRVRLENQVHEIGAMKTAQDRILRSVSSGIIAVDREGVVTSCNRAAAEMLLVDPVSAVGQPLSTLLPPRFMLALGASFGGEAEDPGVTIQGFEMVGELRGRGYVHFEHRLSPLKDDSGATIGYVLALEDRTFLARLERERREAGAERERIMRIFSGMMSPDVLQEVLRIGGEGSGFSGDRRTLSVMFADIRGFTGISERLPPEDVVEMLNGYLGAAADVILEHKGSIDKFIGDAVMALFGAPAPLENHALQAVRAAIAMQRTFAERPAPEGRKASFGIGINTGAGIVGMIGSTNVKSYTAIGDVVNVAARLEGEARAGEILITEDTYQQIASEVNVEPLGSIYVKGRVTPVAVFKVVGLRQ
ncbi:MAG: adenylate/guanylate cyclase domain-containing protein [Chloroflexota bacterium]